MAASRFSTEDSGQRTHFSPRGPGGQDNICERADKAAGVPPRAFWHRTPVPLPPCAPELLSPARSSLRTASRRLTFLAGVTRVIAIVASNPQDPVLDGGHPVGGRLDIHRERGAAAPGAAGRRAKRGARELLQVPPPPPLVLMLQLVLPRPSSDSTAGRSSGFASQRRLQRQRQRSGPHSGRPFCQPGSSPARHQLIAARTAPPHLRRPPRSGTLVGAPPGL